MSPRSKRTKEKDRIVWIKAGFLFLILCIVGRLYMLQVINGDLYSDKASQQYVGKPGTSFDRGSIFFTTKQGNDFSAASLSNGYILALKPDDISNPERLYDQLSEDLELDREQFIDKASKKGDPYEEAMKKIPEETAQRIAKKKYKGVSLHPEKWRYYPGKTLGSQTIGFMSYVEDSYEGAYGVERQYNKILASPTDRLYVNFFAEVFSGIKQVADVEKRTGDIHLTIEPTVQMNLEKVLEDTRKEWNSKMVAGVIINPQNGEIYAMAANPTFDSNEFNTVENPEVYNNPLVSRVFEMGSIIKPLTIAAGIDAGVINAGTTYDDTGTITLDGKKISNYDGKARGIQSMQDVLNKSLNTGVSFVMRQMGTKPFAHYFEEFGMRELSGIDLPHEGVGLTDNFDSPRRVEYATASFGQGFAVNPLVTVRALSTLGNGGYLIRPHVTKSIDYDLGLSDITKNEKGKQVLKKETSEEITRMLIEVVDEALVGGAASLDRWTIAAKTGTAQIAGPGGKYYQDRYLHTFFGYFPAYDPQFLVFLMNDQPEGAEYASQTLTNPFREITKFLLNYYEIPPDR